MSEYEARPDRYGLNLGHNRVAWRNGALHIRLHERTAPWGTPLRGTLILQPEGPAFAAERLHPSRPHWWWPVAPCARLRVQLETPALQWEGRAYHDANWGHEPLARAFSGWSWQRVWHGDGTWVHYAPRQLDGPLPVLSTLYRRDGSSGVMPAPPPVALPRSGWGLERHVSGAVAEIRRLEDTPFYSRSHVQVALPVQAPALAMHEQVDMQRFTQPWVQFLLPFRMRRP